MRLMKHEHIVSRYTCQIFPRENSKYPCYKLITSRPQTLRYNYYKNA